MGRRISMELREELIKTLGKRYRRSSRHEKSIILDEFIQVSGYHRKHAIRLLSAEMDEVQSGKKDRRIYDVAVKEALIVIWEASDRICSKRLKPVIPTLIEALERHGYFALDEDLKSRLISISPASIVRLLASVRTAAGTSRKRRKLTKLKKKIPVKTSSDLHDP